MLGFAKTNVNWCIFQQTFACESYMHRHIHMATYMHTYLGLGNNYLFLLANAWVHTYISRWVYPCVSIHTQIWLHICLHTYIHTYMLLEYAFWQYKSDISQYLMTIFSTLLMGYLEHINAPSLPYTSQKFTHCVVSNQVFYFTFSLKFPDSLLFLVPTCCWEDQFQIPCYK